MRRAALTVLGVSLLGCGSGSTPAPASGTGIGACVQTVKGDPTTIVGCEEYLTGNESILAMAMSTCNGATSSILDNKWAASCPAGMMLGCQYAPGKNGTPGGQILWNYQAGAHCNADATPITPTGAGGAAGGSAGAGGATGSAGASGGSGGASAGAGGASGATGAAGSAAQGTVPATGMFVWMVNGQTLTVSTAPNAANPVAALSVGYVEGANAKDAKSFTINISGHIYPTGESCQLKGQFLTVPPPAGTYPLVATDTDGSFTAACSSGMIDPANPSATMVLVSRSGQVVLTKSGVGDIEGTFAMQGAPLFPLNGPSTAVSGGFNVACSAGVAPTSSSCTAHTAGSGTCADLLACCNKPNAMKFLCMSYYTSLMSIGDASCGNELAVAQTSLCP
jgi:hypothetical protein